MPDPENQNQTDWIEICTRLAGALGFNAVRVRWKLMAWRDSWKSTKNRTQTTLQHINYQHKLCPSCGSVQDRDNKTCSNCGKPLSPRFIQVLRRFGLVAPHFNSVSSMLTFLIAAAYLRVGLAQGGNLLDMNSMVLIRFGANWFPAELAGQWWRVSTYIFLHAGLWHIGFNLIALQQIGPQAEEIFGRGRMLFYFMVTGIVAGLGSAFLGPHGVAIGASGSLMGLIGLAAGWGQRDGTGTGKAVRNLMVKWGVYTVVFGFLIGADNVAHITGFVCGFLMGLASKPRWERHSPGWLEVFITFTGAALALGTAWLVFFPPQLPFDL
jgi:rhomboid protease GluP